MDDHICSDVHAQVLGVLHRDLGGSGGVCVHRGDGTVGDTPRLKEPPYHGGMHTQQFVAEDLAAMAAEYTEQHDILQVLQDPETHAERAFDLGLDIPSLTAWYRDQHTH